ncbi:MAG: PAS domain S-box protein [Haloarculaceae archaeon]
MKQYEAYLEGSTDIITVLDETGTIKYQSPSVTRILGYDPGALVGENGFDFVHPDDVDGVSETFADLVTDPDGIGTAECRFRTADGDWRWLEIRGRNRLDGPTIEGIVANSRDVTERKERERELEETDTLLSTLYETLPVGVTILDAGGEFVRANRRAEEVLGLTESEITDRTYNDPEWEIVDADGDPVPDEDLPFSRVMATGEPVFGYNHGIVWPDGSERWLSIDAAPLRFDGDDVDQVVAVISDVTDKRDYKRTLERRNESLREFASIVSHDLRNPLNVASGRMELVAEECDSDQVEAVQRAHRRMEALIESLLTLARQGWRASDPEPVDLAALARSCWQNVDTADATLVTPADRTVRADRSQLQQLLENLVGNAVEHGGEAVTVTVGDLADGFYVADDGTGIPETARESVFETGYSTAENGTGLGLSIVERVADAHGWAVDLTESEEGGARFEITGVETGVESDWDVVGVTSDWDVVGVTSDWDVAVVAERVRRAVGFRGRRRASGGLRGCRRAVGGSPGTSARTQAIWSSYSSGSSRSSTPDSSARSTSTSHPSP